MTCKIVHNFLRLNSSLCRCSLVGLRGVRTNVVSDQAPSARGGPHNPQKTDSEAPIYLTQS